MSERIIQNILAALTTVALLCIPFAGCTKKEETATSGSKGGKPAAAVSSKFDDVKLSSGTLKKYAKGKYFFLDLSQMNCSGCYELADEMNANKEFQAAVSGGKCSGATLVNDVAPWRAKYAGTFVASHSYQASDLFNVPKSFGEDPIDTTPSVFVIDVETGKAVSTSKDLGAFVKRCT